MTDQAPPFRTFLGYWDEHGNEMHCAHPKCISPEMCLKGCKCPVARVTDQAPELLPCPFCGSMSADIADTGHFWVSCDKCDAEGPTADTQIGAIEAWNTRPPSERPVAQVREALRKLAIAQHVRMAEGGATVPNGKSCRLCKSEWDDTEPEKHAPDCLAALTAERPEAAVAMIERSEFEIVRKASRLFEDAANAWMERALKAEAALSPAQRDIGR